MTFQLFNPLQLLIFLHQENVFLRIPDCPSNLLFVIIWRKKCFYSNIIFPWGNVLLSFIALIIVKLNFSYCYMCGSQNIQNLLLPLHIKNVLNVSVRISVLFVSVDAHIAKLNFFLFLELEPVSYLTNNWKTSFCLLGSKFCLSMAFTLVI